MRKEPGVNSLEEGSWLPPMEHKASEPSHTEGFSAELAGSGGRYASSTGPLGSLRGWASKAPWQRTAEASTPLGWDTSLGGPAALPANL